MLVSRLSWHLCAALTCSHDRPPRGSDECRGRGEHPAAALRLLQYRAGPCSALLCTAGSTPGCGLFWPQYTVTQQAVAGAKPKPQSTITLTPPNRMSCVRSCVWPAGPLRLARIPLLAALERTAH